MGEYNDMKKIGIHTMKRYPNKMFLKSKTWDYFERSIPSTTEEEHWMVENEIRKKFLITTYGYKIENDKKNQKSLENVQVFQSFCLFNNGCLFFPEMRLFSEVHSTVFILIQSFLPLISFAIRIQLRRKQC